MNIEIISVPVIVAVVYALLELFKEAFGDGFKRFLPLCAVALGAAIGYAAFCLCPELIPTDNVFAAILIGAASGWAATGADQTFKQLMNKSDKEGCEKND